MQMNDNIYTTVVLLLLTYNLDDNFYPVAKSLNGRGVIFDNRWVFTSSSRQPVMPVRRFSKQKRRSHELQLHVSRCVWIRV